MAATDVFRPTDGPIYLKSNLSHGLGSDVFEQKYVPMKRPMTQGSRPSTQNRSRFGGRSVNAFFARHNPHPTRVSHLKGLLDVPICSVSDDVHLGNPRYSLQFPPNNHNQIKMHSYSRYFNLPSSAINVNTQSLPINTITGLQYFLGKPMNFRVTGEKSNLRAGIMDVPEVWRDELKQLVAQCGLQQPQEMTRGVEEAAAARQRTPQTARPKTQYSESTGRLIPPPSRAMSRGFSRQSRRGDAIRTAAQEMNMETPDAESMVMGILCQILQTEDMSSVQSWLVNAGDREKQLVQDMLRSALSSQDEYYRQPEVQDYLEERERNRPVTGVLGDDSDPLNRIDRLTLEPSSPRPQTAASPPPMLPPIGQCDEPEFRPPTSHTFRQQSARPASRRLATPKTPTHRLNTPAKLKYTNTTAADTWTQEQSSA